jgi:tetratricopeptide (TPR) repeat protein
VTLERVGSYRIVAPLGEGGMGAVFRAVDERTGREVALKVLQPDLSDDPTFLARFQREARAAAAVRHPAIVTVHEASVSGQVAFMALELVNGGSLKDEIRRRERLPWREAASLFAQVARGLAAIHERGLIHRDVKPANVLLADRPGEARQARLADFGLARRVDPRLSSAAGLTKTGEIVGTFEYMAPEQADARDVDGRADLYALGASLLEALTGRPPFEGSSLAILKQHMIDAPPSVRSRVSEVPPDLDRLVARLLAKDPAARGTAGEIAAELERIASGPAATTGRRAPLAVVALFGTLLVVLVIAMAPWRERPATVERPAAPPTNAPGTDARPVDREKEKVARGASLQRILQLADADEKRALAEVARLKSSPGWQDGGPADAAPIVSKLVARAESLAADLGLSPQPDQISDAYRRARRLFVIARRLDPGVPVGPKLVEAARWFRGNGAVSKVESEAVEAALLVLEGAREEAYVREISEWAASARDKQPLSSESNAAIQEAAWSAGQRLSASGSLLAAIDRRAGLALRRTPDVARSRFERSVTEDGATASDSLAEMGKVLDDAGRPDEALAAWNRAIELVPNNFNARHYRGCALAKGPRDGLARAVDDLKVALGAQRAREERSYGWELATSCALARAQARLGNLEEALAAARGKNTSGLPVEDAALWAALEVKRGGGRGVALKILRATSEWWHSRPDDEGRRAAAALDDLAARVEAAKDPDLEGLLPLPKD